MRRPHHGCVEGHEVERQERGPVSGEGSFVRGGQVGIGGSFREGVEAGLGTAMKNVCLPQQRKDAGPACSVDAYK